MKVIIDAFSLTIQHDGVFDPEMFEHNRRVQHRVDNLPMVGLPIEHHIVTRVINRIVII